MAIATPITIPLVITYLLTSFQDDVINSMHWDYSPRCWKGKIKLDKFQKKSLVVFVRLSPVHTYTQTRVRVLFLLNRV